MTFPHRRYPCDECPIRADNTDNPKSKFPAERWQALSVSVRHDGHQPGFGDPLFGCHKGAPGTDEDLACAGWLARFGDDHIAVRLAVAQGRLSDDALGPGETWPPLHETWADVVAHQSSVSGPAAALTEENPAALEAAPGDEEVGR